MIPMIKNITKTGIDTLDLLSYEFVKKRTIRLAGEINDSLATEVVMQLEYLDETGDGDITLVINSPGGHVTSGLSIIDAMNRCRCDVRTVASGLCASMASFVLACGTKGKRFVTPNCETMIHQPIGGVQGQATDIQLVAEHITKTKLKLASLLVENTGKSLDVVTEDCERDHYLSAEEAVEYGLADAILK
ncbi:MAG: ATP-dependent Clp protease proteolytic subunit [Clostridia bacterium]|nr:ATP-dependent Clp protease proteolytic subunit [Clostridia bacterium]